MDILNWLYLVKKGFTRTTVENPDKDLILLGADATFVKRGDKYQNYVMTVTDFKASLKAYKSTVLTLTQAGTAAPVIENTLINEIGGTWSTTYTGAGEYTIANTLLTGANEVAFVTNNQALNAVVSAENLVGSIAINTLDPAAGTNANDLLAIVIEIRQYV